MKTPNIKKLHVCFLALKLWLRLHMSFLLVLIFFIEDSLQIKGKIQLVMKIQIMFHFVTLFNITD